MQMLNEQWPIDRLFRISTLSSRKFHSGFCLTTLARGLWQKGTKCIVRPDHVRKVTARHTGRSPVGESVVTGPPIKNCEKTIAFKKCGPPAAESWRQAWQHIASTFPVWWLPHDCACSGLSARSLLHKCAHRNASNYSPLLQKLQCKWHERFAQPYNLGSKYHEMPKNNQTHRAAVVTRVTKDRDRALGRGPRSKIRDSLPISYPQVETPRCARYATGEANGDSPECLYPRRLEGHA